MVDLHMALTGSDLKDSIKELKEYANIKDSYNYSNNMRYKDISDNEKMEEYKKFELPKKSSKGYKNMFAYLIKQRCIDADVITSMMKRKLIYQDENRNVVFVGYNQDKEPVCATKRSTNTGSTYKGDVLGSDKSYGFYIKNSSNTLFVTESPIDVFSIMTFCKLKSKSFNENNYLALLGATNYRALENTLNSNKNITNVVLCMDNDNAGKKALEELKNIISEKYNYIQMYQMKPKQKDFNEDLVMYVSKLREHNKSLKKEMEKEEEKQLSV